MIKPEDLLIINSMDRPCIKHLMQRNSDGTASYINKSLLTSTDVKFTTEEAVSLKDFGFDLDSRGVYVKVRPSIAKYSSGQTREWQDCTTSFTYDNIKNNECY
jgi:predicted HTH transcriptional regulator